MNKKVLGCFAVLGLVLSSAASAVPCGYFGVAPSTQCQDGTGVLDSATVLNSGSYFSVSNWQLLDRADSQGDSANSDFWQVVGASSGLPGGAFQLADDLWTRYSTLAVSLAGGGAWPVGSPAGTPAVNWSLYQLVPGQSLYFWVYGATRSGLLQNLYTITLYGVESALAPTRVAEPATIGLVLFGAVAVGIIARRRRMSAA